MQELKAKQETPDAPEALACIPSLHLGGEKGAWALQPPLLSRVTH